MPKTYYDSELTGAEIESVLQAIHGVVSPSNNGKILAIESGRFVAKSASEYSGDAVLEPLNVTANGDYYPRSGTDGFDEVHVSVPSATLTTKSITQNGTYNASSDNADGYSSVTVNVSGGGSAVVQPLSVTENGTYNPPSGVDGYAPVTVNVSGGGGGIVSVDHNIYTYTPNVTAAGAMSAGFAFTVDKSLVISKIRVFAVEAIVSAHIMDGSTYIASLNDVSVTANQWNDLTLSDMVTLVPGKTYTCWYSHKTAHPRAVAAVASPYVPFITYLHSVYSATADTVPDRTESGTMMGADLFLHGIVADGV